MSKLINSTQSNQTEKNKIPASDDKTNSNNQQSFNIKSDNHFKQKHKQKKNQLHNNHLSLKINNEHELLPIIKEYLSAERQSLRNSYSYQQYPQYQQFVGIQNSWPNQQYYNCLSPKFDAIIEEKQNKKIINRIMSRIRFIDEIKQLDDIQLLKTIPEPDKPIRKILKKIPKPKLLDTTNEQNQLQEIKKKKVKYIFIKLKNGINLLNCIKKYIIQTLNEKIQQNIVKIKENEEIFIGELQQQVEIIAQSQYDSFTQKEIQLSIIQTQSITEKDKLRITKNSSNLQLVLTQIINQIVSLKLSQQAIEYLSLCCQNYSHLPDNEHFKIEIENLIFSTTGSIIDLTQKQQIFRVAIEIFIKNLIPSFEKVFNNKQNIKPICKENFKIILSIIYYIIISLKPKQIQKESNENNNCKIPIPRNENYILLQEFVEEPQQKLYLEEQQKSNSNLPLIHPLYIYSELELFFEMNNEFIKVKQKQLIDFCLNIIKKINKFQQNKLTKLKEGKQQQNDRIKNENQNKLQQAYKIYRNNRVSYLDLCREIKQIMKNIETTQQINNELQQQYQQKENERLKKQKEIDINYEQQLKTIKQCS